MKFALGELVQSELRKVCDADTEVVLSRVAERFQCSEYSRWATVSILPRSVLRAGKYLSIASEYVPRTT
jgi:hypothetical protein